MRLRSRPGADPSELAATLFELANTHFYAGHYDISESINQRVLALHRANSASATRSSPRI